MLLLYAVALCCCPVLMPMLLCWQVQEMKGQQLKQLVHALCPAIYGHELVKAGVLLCLFGGVRKGSEDQASAPVRGDIHCLLVGDPGIGKSQLLKVQLLSASLLGKIRDASVCFKRAVTCCTSFYLGILVACCHKLCSLPVMAVIMTKLLPPHCICAYCTASAVRKLPYPRQALPGSYACTDKKAKFVKQGL